MGVQSLTEKGERKKDEIDDGDDWEDYIPQPPDGGWGWVVMIASFCNNFILDGIAYCFGVFITEYGLQFNASLGMLNLANSLLCGVYLIEGPIVGALVNKFGCRPVGIVGSIIGASAFVLSIFSPNIQFMIFSYGFLGGIGFGMMYLPAVVGVGYYFEKKRAIATGIAVCGTGFGTSFMAPFGQALLQVYDWKNAHLILAGLLLNGCISSAMMRPLIAKRRVKKHDKKEIKAEMKMSSITAGDAVNEKKSPDTEALLEGKSAANGTPHSGRRERIGQSESIGSTHLQPDSAAHKLHASAYLKTTSTVVSKQDLSRPLYKKDIFYSGSIYNIAQFKSSEQDVKTYVTSITSIPSMQDHQRMACLNKLPKPMADILAEMLDLTVLKSRGMMVLCAANIIGMIGFYAPIVFSVNRAKNLGVSATDAAFLLSIMGISNTIGRVASGLLSTIPGASALLINNICITLAGVAVLLTPFCVVYETMAAAIAIYGLFCSTFMSLASVIMCELVGLEKLTNGFGLLCLVRGITAVAGPPVQGILCDVTGNYDATFYMGGACLIISGLLHFLLHLKYFKREQLVKP